MTRLLGALRAPNTTVLFDGFAIALARGQAVNELAQSRSLRAVTGAGLLERLPTFPDAPMSMVLEARDELTEGRSAYRRAVKDLTGKLISSAFDETLPSEIDELWNDTVRPELRAMKRTISASQIARATGGRLINEKLTAGSSIAVTIASLSGMVEQLPR